VGLRPSLRSQAPLKIPHVLMNVKPRSKGLESLRFFLPPSVTHEHENGWIAASSRDHWENDAQKTGILAWWIFVGRLPTFAYRAVLSLGRDPRGQNLGFEVGGLPTQGRQWGVRSASLQPVR